MALLAACCNSIMYHRTTSPHVRISVPPRLSEHIGTEGAGLGMGIVEALARNLQCEIQLSAANPGTIVTISHLQAGNPQADISTAA